MLFACAPSQAPVDMLVETANAAATLGTAVHDGCTSIVAGLPVDVQLLALRHGVDERELAILLHFARQAWTELAPSFPDARTEVGVEYEHDAFTLTGHIDVLSVLDGHARFIDWKTGRKEEADYYAQLAGYALCLILGLGLKSATASVVWLRSQTIETYTFTAADVHAFAARLREASDHANDGRYRYGQHCSFCQRSHSCPALAAIARRDVAIFAAGDVTESIATMDSAAVVSVRRRLKVLQTFAESCDQAIRRRVAEGGPLDSGDGYQLALVEENGKREIDTAKAWPILQDHLDDQELAGCVTVSAKAVDDAVSSKAGRGNGKSAREALRLELEAAGAVTQAKVEKLKEIRLPKQLNAKEVSDGK
jgi:hypothetical protein